MYIKYCIYINKAINIYKTTSTTTTPRTSNEQQEKKLQHQHVE